MVLALRSEAALDAAKSRGQEVGRSGVSVSSLARRAAWVGDAGEQSEGARSLCDLCLEVLDKAARHEALKRLLARDGELLELLLDARALGLLVLVLVLRVRAAVARLAVVGLSLVRRVALTSTAVLVGRPPDAGLVREVGRVERGLARRRCRPLLMAGGVPGRGVGRLVLLLERERPGVARVRVGLGFGRATSRKRETGQPPLGSPARPSAEPSSSSGGGGQAARATGSQTHGVGGGGPGVRDKVGVGHGEERLDRALLGPGVGLEDRLDDGQVDLRGCEGEKTGSSARRRRRMG